MRRFFTLVFGLLIASSAALAADVSGVWEGTLSASRPDGTAIVDRLSINLKQDGTTVTGFIAVSETEQHPIAEGTMKDNELTLKIGSPRGDIILELNLDGDRLKGTGRRPAAGDSAVVELTRKAQTR